MKNKFRNKNGFHPLNKINKQIQVGTWVQVAGVDGWHRVKEINDTRVYLKVDGLAGSFQAGHIARYTNSRAQTLSAYGKKLKRIAEHLTGITGLWPNYKDNVFGACHAPNTSFSRLDGDCGQVVLLEESSSSWTIESYTVFDSFEEYRDWYNNQLDDYGKGHYKHYGDCSLAYRAAKNLGWVGDCDDDQN